MRIGHPVDGYAKTNSKPVFPTWVRAMIVIVSILKAIPLLFVGLVGMALSGTLASYDDEFGSEIGASMAILAVPLLLLFGLLLMQTIGALASRATPFFTGAVIVSLIDALILLGLFLSLANSGGASGSEVFFFAVIGMQWAALIGGFKNKPR